MSDRLTSRDVEVVGGDVLVSIPGDGTVLSKVPMCSDLLRRKGSC